MRTHFDFTIGADPEFNIMIKGERLDAHHAISTMFKGQELNIKKGKKLAGELGWDGHSATGEIRPEPGETADEVVENMRAIYNALIERIPIATLSTISVAAPVGGHVHLSIPEALSTEAKMQKIHRILSTMSLPLIMNDNYTNMTLRLKSGGYGQITDWRPADYSDARGYEFRPLSAEWTTTPKVALGTLAYIGTIYHEILNNTPLAKEMARLSYNTIAQGKALQTLIMQEYTHMMGPLIKEIISLAKKSEFYNIYKDEIDYITNKERVMKDKKEAAYDISKGWSKEETKKISKRMLSNGKALKEAMIQRGVDNTLPFSGIAFNRDTNVELFARAISDRINSFNWKLQNDYFFFGIKKGIKNYIAMDHAITANEIDAQHIYAGKEIIGTIEDKKRISDLMLKMSKKIGKRENGTLHKINKIIGIEDHRGTIVIGIPYEKRIKKDVLSLVKLIYDIERNGHKKKELFDDISPEGKENNKDIAETICSSNTEEGMQALRPYSITAHVNTLEEALREEETESVQWGEA